MHWFFDGNELEGWMASMVCFLSSRVSVQQGSENCGFKSLMIEYLAIISSL